MHSITLTLFFVFKLIFILFNFLLQEQLNEVVRVWNTHRIRHSRNQNVVSGRALLLYTMPTVYGCRDYSMQLEEAEVNTCIDSCIFREYPCDEDVFILCMTYMVDNDISPPTTAIEGVNIFLELRDFIRTGLE